MVNTNISPIFKVCDELVQKLLSRLPTLKKQPSEEEMRVFDEMVLYWLFEKHRVPVCELMHEQPQETHYECYQAFLEDFDATIRHPARRQPSEFTPEKTFAVIFQIHRAFYHIFDFIAGGSLEAAQMRADIWQSIFTYDIYRYHRLLFDRMNNVTTLITGESGTGKEVVARTIHEQSPVSSGPFVAINIGGVPENLLESELFGYEKGAFTGAVSRKAGMFELANGGTLFLDEIGDMPYALQVKILRVLQERSITRLGGTEPIPINARIVCATNKDLESLVREGKFREDLFFRLNVVRIHIPPLRERKDDIPLLAAWIIKKINSNMGRHYSGLTPEAMEKLKNYDFYGNIREMENILERAAIFSDGDLITEDNIELRGDVLRPARLEEKEGVSGTEGLSLKEIEKQTIEKALRRWEGNRTRAAKELGITRRTLITKIEEYDLDV
jgi:hypothetical protein